MDVDVVIPQTTNKKTEECIATEEYAVISENILSSPALPTFHKRKHEIYRRLQVIVLECKNKFSGRKELASEESYCVAQLCETLEIAFGYGLKQQQQLQQLPNLVASAASLFHNMQEIVTGGASKGNTKLTSNAVVSSADPCFWDFCKKFLTTYECERFEKLKQTWTKWGKGRAFIRAALNEHSLHRYILTWLSEKELLHAYYSHWALLTDESITASLPELIKSLDQVLFALNVDKTELNAAVKTYEPIQEPVTKEEPVIYAPTPVKIESKIKGKSTIVERPIATSSSTEDLLKQLQGNSNIIKVECLENGSDRNPDNISETVTEPLCEQTTQDDIKIERITETSETNDVETELNIPKQTFLEFGSTLPCDDSEKTEEINPTLKVEVTEGGNTLSELQTLLSARNGVDLNDICVEKELEMLKKTFKEFTTTLPSVMENFETKSQSSLSSDTSSSNNTNQFECNNPLHSRLEEQLKEANDKCFMLETKVAQLTLENLQLMMRLKKFMEDSKINLSSTLATNAAS
ncbi:uncharacterized protein [Musca autumnalis]|uniref:uncharacterized protein n=1 Tax=Musca autumnalis TaxID=221902 RepID=UPI003CEE441B